MQRIALLEVPSALPVLPTTLRLAAANSILAALVAEFLMGTRGLGYLIGRACAGAAGGCDVD
jgi:NitT/TauT family transport system permease protein